MAKSIKTTDYSVSKKAFTFKADSELRGINATCKVILSMYDNKDRDLLSVLAYDSMKIDYFVDKSFINVAKIYTPNYFDSKGQICSLRKLYKETEDKYKDFEKTFESLNGVDGVGEYKFFKIPVYKWSTNGLYNFAKRAYKAKDKAINTLANLHNSGINLEELKKDLSK